VVSPDLLPFAYLGQWAPPLAHRAAVTAASNQPGPGTTLADWIRYLGVLLSVIGALAVAPNALPVWLKRFREASRRALDRARDALRRLLKRPVPGGDGGVALKKPGIHATAHAGRVKGGGGGIWEHLRRAEKDIDDLFAKAEMHDERIGTLAAAQEQDAAALQRARQELLAAMAERYRQAERIDADALPLVAAGILIAGIPGELAAWHLGYASIAIAGWLSFVGWRKLWSAWRAPKRPGKAGTAQQPAAAGQREAQRR